jgi:two-component system, NtrC family, nitrogen regulation sensor histidine kinase GlnL
MSADTTLGALATSILWCDLSFRFPGSDTRLYADALLSRREDGRWWLEAHLIDEFPGDDPATVLPPALTAALKGLAHELRNPLAGLKGAAQLLSRRIVDDDACELIGLIDRLLCRRRRLCITLVRKPSPANTRRDSLTP